MTRRDGKTAKLLRRFIGETHGVAAIEFAMVLPVLAAIAVTLPDVGNIAFGDMNMEAAVRATAQYAMNGGSDMTRAQAIGNSAWTSKPSGGTLTASQQCICGSAAGTCGQLCLDGSQPMIYVTASASARFGGTVISLPLTTTQVVRIR